MLLVIDENYAVWTAEKKIVYNFPLTLFFFTIKLKR